jgi:uncharacterized protein YigE (DUF2233 family)
MKRLILFIFTLFIVGAIALFTKNLKPTQKSNVLPAETYIVTPTPISIKQSVVLDFEGSPIRISWTIVSPGQVELYSNLEEQYLSEQIKVDKSCQILVNGGFYSQSNTHLGLIITNFKNLSPFSESPTRNGFLWIKANSVFIGNDLPDDNPRIAIQSGPLLMQKNEIISLNIRNDEPSRRIVAGTIDNKKLIFLAVYRNNSEYQGPMLGKLPEIINLFKNQTNINIVDAINLDGGSASVFISNYVRLVELAHIGSYFCIK